MFTHTPQIPRSPLASTLTIVFHVSLGLFVVLVTAIPSIPREHKTEALTYIVAAPVPDLRFEIPKPTPPPTPPPLRLEVPRPEPPKIEKPFVERPAPPPPPPAPERRVVEPPKEIPITRPVVKVVEFADPTATMRKLEKPAEVAAVNFDAPSSANARVKLDVQTIDGFDPAATRATTPKATVTDARFGPVTPGASAPRATLTPTTAGFSNDTTPRPAPTTTTRPPTAAGFGEVTARPAPAAAKPPPQVTTFADPPPAPPRPAPQAPPPPRADRPVEVLYKPTPGYTDDARAQHIEGEVTLEVEFSAAGQVRVLRVVHGLGHGLDEMAQRAAEQIRFKPATSKGTPVDFRANLTILFRLT
jgi:TonB family protein